MRVTAAPESGKANAAVCALLARLLHVPKSSVRVVRGESSRHKQIEIDGVGDTELAETFGTPDAGLF